MFKRAFFLCCSVYHLNVALYYAMKVEWKETEIILVWQNNTNAVVNMDVFHSYFDKIVTIRGKDILSYPFYEQQIYKTVQAGWLFPLSIIGKMLRENPSGNIIFLFNDVARLTNKVTTEFGRRKGNKIILVDEGLGTYVMIPDRKSLKTTIGNVLCGQLSETYLGDNKYIQCIFARYIDHLPKRRVKGREVIQQNNIFSDEQWIRELGLIPETVSSSTIDAKKKMLWVGQPLSMGFIKEEIERKTLEKILEIVSRQYHIVFKLHPQENRDKYIRYLNLYDCEILPENENGWIPVESLVGVIKPDLIATPFSSAPLGIKESFICLYLYPLFGIESINEKLIDIVADKPNMLIVNDMEDLKNIINNDCSNSCVENNDTPNEDIDYITRLISK